MPGRRGVAGERRRTFRRTRIPAGRSGWRRLPSGGVTARKRSRVAAEGSGNSSPAAAHASAKRIPSPPPFVTTATRGPLGNGCVERIRAASRNSESVRARWTPACRKSASTAASELARAAVCEAAARAPAALAPPFNASTGFPRETRRAIRANRAGFPKLSRYRATTAVAASSSQYSRRSLEETSALLPRDTKAERPSPRARACSTTARPSAPLCEANPTLPGGRTPAANVALSRCAEDAMPRQFGPMRRPPCARTRSSSAACLPSALRADLGEAGRDHAERAHTRCEGVSGGGENRPCRHADDCQIDDWMYPGKRRPCRNPLDGLAAAVDRNDLSGEVPCEHIAEEFAADGAAPRRRAVHGDACGSEKCPKRGRHGHVVAIVDPGDIAAGRLDQQGRLDHTTGHSLLHSEPRRVDDIEHLVIARAGSRTRVARFRPRRRVPPVARADACPLRLPASRRQRRTRPRRRQDRAGGRSSRERPRAHSQLRPARRSAPPWWSSRARETARSARLAAADSRESAATCSPARARPGKP